MLLTLLLAGRAITEWAQKSRFLVSPGEYTVASICKLVSATGLKVLPDQSVAGRAVFVYADSPSPEDFVSGFTKTLDLKTTAKPGAIYLKSGKTRLEDLRSMLQADCEKRMEQLSDSLAKPYKVLQSDLSITKEEILTMRKHGMSPTDPKMGEIRDRYQTLSTVASPGNYALAKVLLSLNSAQIAAAGYRLPHPGDSIPVDPKTDGVQDALANKDAADTTIIARPVDSWGSLDWQLLAVSPHAYQILGTIQFREPRLALPTPTLTDDQKQLPIQAPPLTSRLRVGSLGFELVSFGAKALQQNFAAWAPPDPFGWPGIAKTYTCGDLLKRSGFSIWNKKESGWLTAGLDAVFEREQQIDWDPVLPILAQVDGKTLTLDGLTHYLQHSSDDQLRALADTVAEYPGLNPRYFGVLDGACLIKALSEQTPLAKLLAIEGPGVIHTDEMTDGCRKYLTMFQSNSSAWKDHPEQWHPANDILSTQELSYRVTSEQGYKLLAVGPVQIAIYDGHETTKSK